MDTPKAGIREQKRVWKSLFSRKRSRRREVDESEVSNERFLAISESMELSIEELLSGELNESIESHSERYSPRPFFSTFEKARKFIVDPQMVDTSERFQYVLEFDQPAQSLIDFNKQYLHDHIIQICAVRHSVEKLWKKESLQLKSRI